MKLACIRLNMIWVRLSSPVHRAPNWMGCVSIQGPVTFSDEAAGLTAGSPHAGPRVQ